MTPTSRARLAITLFVGITTALFACSTGTSDGDSCEEVCGAVPDCEGASCMSQCVALQSACTESGQGSAFSDWASCRPTLACMAGSFVPLTCASQNTAIMACGTTPITLSLPREGALGSGSAGCSSKGGDASPACRP